MYEMVDTIDRGLLKLCNVLVTDITNYMLTLPKYKTITRVRKVRIQKAVNCFIHNTFNTYCNGRRRSQVTLDQNHFGTGGIINGVVLRPKVSYTYTKLLLDALEELNYIVLVKGCRSYEWDLKTHSVVCVDICSYVEYQLKLQLLYEQYKGVYTTKLIRNIYELRDDDIKSSMNTMGSVLKATHEEYQVLRRFNKDL